jgi:WS/DGAT/MGAT family acyltransferase
VKQQPTAEAMSPMDELFFRSERDPIRRPTTYAIYVLESAPKWTDLQHTFERAGREFLRFRQRVVEPTGGVGPAHWAVDPRFDLDFHLRRAAVPPSEDTSAEGRFRALLDALEPELMTPLDLSRPLWYATLYEGLADGQAALFFKASHAIADGLGGVQISMVLFDDQEGADLRPMPSAPESPDLSGDQLAQNAISDMPGAAVDRVKGMFGRARRWLAEPSQVSEYIASLRRVMSETAPPSPLLAERGASRRLLVLEFPLADMKAAAKGAGASINDAYLAVLSGAMRRYHEELEQPVDAIPIAIPISTRRAEDDEGGNQFTGGMLALPLDGDPRDCMSAIRQDVLRIREEAALDFFDHLTPLMLGLPTAVTARTAESIPAPDLQASNVPAHPVPIYIAGARVLKQIGIGPVPGIAVMATMLSYCGQCAVSFNIDPAAVTDLPLFERCLRDALEEVLAFGQATDQV